MIVLGPRMWQRIVHCGGHEDCPPLVINVQHMFVRGVNQAHPMCGGLSSALHHVWCLGCDSLCSHKSLSILSHQAERPALLISLCGRAKCVHIVCHATHPIGR
jgi:hypothetical protein